MYTIVKKIRFCYGHRLMNYEGQCAHPHGHNAVAEIELVGDSLDTAGMLCDFGDVEKVLSSLIEDRLDHQMLLREDDPLVEALKGVGEDPFEMPENPTAENIARLIFGEAREKGLQVVAVRVWETEDAFAEYRSDPKIAVQK